jgi:hypothetical protein
MEKSLYWEAAGHLAGKKIPHYLSFITVFTRAHNKILSKLGESSPQAHNLFSIFKICFNIITIIIITTIIIIITATNNTNTNNNKLVNVSSITILALAPEFDV